MFKRIENNDSLPLKQANKDFRVACILDEFSFAGFEPEGNFLQLSPSKWQEELNNFKPNLLLVESAWRGKNDLWTNMVHRCGPEILGIIEWCNAHNIPTAFWNKEDPVHYSTFLNLASHFDIILTTDLDCVPRYKQMLGKDSVHFFPFAAQPRVHNPIEKFLRADAFCFAGSYYVKYPERTQALESFVNTLADHKPFLIFDRNFGSSGTQHENYQFPAEYQDKILGRLEPSEIEYAYKGFTTGINLNSVQDSQSMLARRVYELMASNTLVISNYSRSLETLFGDLVIASDRGEKISARLTKISTIENGELKLRAQALRKILREHTYRHRMQDLIEWSGYSSGSSNETVVVFSFVRSQDDVSYILEILNAQTFIPAKVILVTDSPSVYQATESVDFYGRAQLDEVGLQTALEDFDLLAVLDPQDFYGPEYLADLVAAREYVDCQGISKASAKATLNIETTLPEFINSEASSLATNKLYSKVNSIEFRRSIVEISALKLSSVNDIFRPLKLSSPHSLFVIDQFEYLCEGRNLKYSDQTNVLSAIVEEGYSLDELRSFTRKAEKVSSGSSIVELSRLFPEVLNSTNSVSLSWDGESLKLESSLEEGKHTYIYSREKISLLDLPWEKEGTVFAEISPGLNLMAVVLFFDENQERLSHVMISPNQNSKFDIPEYAQTVQFGIRVAGPGAAVIFNLHVSPYILPSVGPRTNAQHLILTNIYPSYDNLYRNGFVHSRVTAYEEVGLKVEVICLTDVAFPRYREFDGISVLELNKQDLERVIRNSDVKSVLVHFLDQAMWDVISDTRLGVDVHIWVHGSEVQPWWRREYNATNESELEKAKTASAKRVAMWREIFEDLPDHVDFVFVSQYFANEVMEDIGVELPPQKYRIIHNPIDGDVFNYIPKEAAQRLKILSIRPYASRKYANDLSVETVLLLSEEAFFKDLEFSFFGDGVMFDETLAPLRKFKNVSIHRGFLSHVEIAQEHKKHGVLLTPTRMDAQGVSRDEGMSSGLVPLTTDVAAVPEFVDELSGFLAPLDDAKELAAGIRKLYEDPNLFLRMSEAAASRVRMQSEKKLVLAQELNLIQGLTRIGSQD